MADTSPITDAADFLTALRTLHENANQLYLYAETTGRRGNLLLFLLMAVKYLKFALREEGVREESGD